MPQRAVQKFQETSNSILKRALFSSTYAPVLDKSYSSTLYLGRPLRDRRQAAGNAQDMNETSWLMRRRCVMLALATTAAAVSNWVTAPRPDFTVGLIDLSSSEPRGDNP
jgi:hypothetical protein